MMDIEGRWCKFGASQGRCQRPLTVMQRKRVEMEMAALTGGEGRRVGEWMKRWTRCVVSGSLGHLGIS